MNSRGASLLPSHSQMGSRSSRQIVTSLDGRSAMWTGTAIGPSSPPGLTPSLFTRVRPMSASGKVKGLLTLTTRGGAFARAETPDSRPDRHFSGNHVDQDLRGWRREHAEYS